MSASRPGFFARWFGRFWRLLDGTRRLLLNLLFLALIAALVWAFATRAPAPLQDKTVLVLQLRGPVVEQFSGSWRDTALGRVRGQPAQQVQLRDVLDVLDAAAKDPQITQALLMLDDFQGAGLATLREISAALQRFKAAGKPVVAWGSRFDQRQYHVASAADEVLLHPMGLVYLEGYGRYRNYYRDALDRLGVHGQPDPRRHLQELRRALRRERPVAGLDRGREPAQQRPVDLVHRRRRTRAQARPGQRDARHRRAAAASGRGRRRRGQAGARRQAGGRAEDARRTAPDADRARRARRQAEELPPGELRRLPAAPEAEARRRCGGRGGGRRRDRRRRGAARAHRRPVHRGADPQGARGRAGQGAGAARRFPRRQRLRRRADPARAGAHARGRQAGGGVDGRPGGLGRLLGLDRRRRGHRRCRHRHRLDRRLHAAADRRARRSTSSACTPAASPPPGWALPTTRAAPSTRASPRWCKAASTTPMPTSSARWPPRASARRHRSTPWRRAACGPARRRWSAAWSTGSAAMAMRSAPLRCAASCRGPSAAGTASPTWSASRGGCSSCWTWLGASVLEGLARHIDAALPDAGLPLQAAREMQQDLLWLAELTQQRRPYALAVHCLCADP